MHMHVFPAVQQSSVEVARSTAQSLENPNPNNKKPKNGHFFSTTFVIK